MKHLHRIILAALLLFVTMPGRATILVSNVWNTGVRSYPAFNNTNSPYSEMGTDYNLSSDFESAWFSSSSAALTVPAPGDLRAVQPTSSLSTTTYFTPEGSEVTLANAGDQLKITWVFTPTTVSSANTSQAFPLAVVNTPVGSRITADGNSPPSAAYTGYAMFMNMGQTLGGSTPLQLKEWNVVGSGNLLSSSGNWTGLANGVTSGVHGFDSGTQYTFTMTFTRNASSGLDITASMSGGTYNNTGVGSVSFTDTTPNSFSFDTFAIRPTGSINTAAQWDTSLFKVDFATASAPPSIDTDPQNQAVFVGQGATLSVLAGGSEPLSYQWLYNTNTMLTNATSSTVTVTNVQLGHAGSYSVVVSNLAGGVSSTNAFLTINTTPLAPVFSSQPASQIALMGGTASFTALADGTAPISYQWSKNGVPISGATSSTLNLAGVQISDGGSTYTVMASNSVGQATSSGAVLTVTTAVPVVNSAFNLTGFGKAATGGGVIPENSPAYAKVTTPLELANAVIAFNKTGGIKVIEIMNDLDLGWSEIGPSVQNLASTPFTAAATPLLHPRLLTTGVSKLDIKYKNGGLTIFSANGATIRHCTFNIKSTYNIIVRNLKFDEMWEWDESSKGQYDKNDWDFIDLGNGGSVSNIWIDHCTFTKSYDGILDTKAGSSGITISWCKYTGDDGASNTNSFVRQQINQLELNPASYPMYNFLRTHGFSVEDIVTIIQGHDKTHLAGSNEFDANNATISMTFHHLWFSSVWDRCVPRLRAGNVHNYNLYAYDTLVLAAKRLRDARAAAMSTANRNTLNSTYSFNPPINGSISTENGAVLVEKSVYTDCLWPLRNNQADPSNPAYTGKIKALDTIYEFDGAIVRGNSTDAGNPLGPFQAPVIPFSWNLPGNQLPYTYTPDDPAQLQAIVTSLTTGAGAGVLAWAKTNWLLNTYPSTAPFIVTQPQNATNTTGQSIAFTVVAGGTGPLAYQWYFNTNTPLPNATNFTFTIDNIQATNAGTYSVIVTNSAGSITSTNALLNVSTIAPAKPQVSGLAYANGTFSLSVNGDAGHDYIIQTSTNLAVWTSVFTNPSPTLPFDWSDLGAGDFNRRFYRIQMGP